VTDHFSLDLLGGFAVRHGDRPVELPPACQRLVALLALKRRPVHRLWVCAMLWPHTQTRRAVASLRSTMWRLRPAGADPLLTVDPQYVALSSDVTVDWHDASDHIVRLLDDDEPAGVDPQLVADLLPLLRAGDLLEGWSEKWVVRERVRYRTMRAAAMESLGRRSRDQVLQYACGSSRSVLPHRSFSTAPDESDRP
jgi:DNA-binding SARP family transcriptional activator